MMRQFMPHLHRKASKKLSNEHVASLVVEATSAGKMPAAR
jgi:hypothetical protein